MSIDPLPTFITKSLEWLTIEIDDLVKQKTSFEINSFVRIFNPQDAFNQEFYKDQKIDYPFIAYRVRNIALAVERAGSMMSRRKGVPISTIGLSNVLGKDNSISYATDATGQRIKVSQIWPIDLVVDISFFTNTPQQFEEFLLAWFETYPSLGADVIFSDDIKIPVSMYPEVGPIDYPTSDDSGDKGTFYRGEVVANMQSFSGRLPDVAAIKSYSLGDVPPTLDMEVLTDKNGNAVGNIIKVSIAKS